MRNLIKDCLAQGIFSTLSDAEREAIAACMSVVRISAGKEVPSSTGFCVLLSGELAACHGSREIAILSRGEAFGAWGIWGWMQPRLTMHVVSDAEIAILDEDTFKNLIGTHPELAIRMMHAVPERVDPDADFKAVLLEATDIVPEARGIVVERARVCLDLSDTADQHAICPRRAELREIIGIILLIDRV
jgi:CRP-like cAMP-binding protein